MSDDAAIRKVLDDRARAIHDKNAAAAVGYYAEDIVNFDVAPPLASRGNEATDPSEMQRWFDSWDGPIGLALDQITIRTVADLAYAYGFLHLTGRRTDGSDTDVWLRITVCLERRMTKWMIVHEHQSFPTRMDGSGLSASDLQPTRISR